MLLILSAVFLFGKAADTSVDTVLNLDGNVTGTCPMDSTCESILVKYPLIHHLSVNAGVDYLPSSIVDDTRDKIPSNQLISNHSDLPVNLRYSFSFTNPKIRNYYPGGYQGIGVGVLNIGGLESGSVDKSRRYIGYPVATYLFQGGPVWKMHRNLGLDYEWNFGASFGWKPFSAYNQNFNLTVGSKVNAYLNLNLLLKWQINENVALVGGVAVSHFSNGNTSWPNPGVNSFGLRAGMQWTFNPQKVSYTAIQPDTIKKRKVVYDISLWFAARKRVYRGGEEPILLRGHYAVGGISFSPMARLNPWWRVGGSLDIQWDESSSLKDYYVSGSTTDDILFRRPNFFRQTSIGLSAHGELQMPVFAVNVGVGYNVIAPWENRYSYQNITLKTYLTDWLYLNVGYQLRNFHQQSNLMLGLGFSL